MDEMKYIEPAEAEFYKSKWGFACLKLGETQYTRISLHRAFPFSYSNNFVSVRDKEGKEIGIIKDIEEFPKETLELFQLELSRRYLLPNIEHINSIKEEFGYAYWDVATDIGDKKFIIKRDNNSFVNVKDNRILIVDVDGNRYEISDYTKLDSKSFRLIELML